MNKLALVVRLSSGKEIMVSFNNASDLEDFITEFNYNEDDLYWKRGFDAYMQNGEG